MHDFPFIHQSPVDDENGEENDDAAADLLPVKVYYCMPHTGSRHLKYVLKLLQHDNENNNSTNMISSLSWHCMRAFDIPCTLKVVCLFVCMDALLTMSSLVLHKFNLGRNTQLGLTYREASNNVKWQMWENFDIFKLIADRYYASIFVLYVGPNKALISRKNIYENANKANFI